MDEINNNFSFYSKYGDYNNNDLNKNDLSCINTTK